MSTRLTVGSSKIRWIVASGAMTVRPPEPTIGPSPARIPTIVRSTGPDGPWRVTVPPTVIALAAASVWVTRAADASGPGSD
jgi:hypothetical protein